MTNEQKQANDLGIPLSNTCKELQWIEPTFFCYFEGQLCHSLSYSEKWEEWSAREVIDSDSHCISNKKTDFVPAPNFKQLFEILPDSIKYEAGFNDTEIRYSRATKYLIENSIGYKNHSEFDDWLLNKNFVVNIENNNFAQAAAELFLKLKNSNLLTK